MKYVMLLYTGYDCELAERLEDYFEGRLRNIADLGSITGVLAEKQKLSWALRSSDCVVLFATSQASSLIKDKKQETEDGFLTFDGKVIHDAFTGNKELVDKLIIVHPTERRESDWIPDGFDEKRIFQLKGEKIQAGPMLYQLEYSIRRTLGQPSIDM